MNEQDEFIRALETQNAGYAFLARLYEKEVDADLLNRLCEMKLPAHTGNENLDRGYRGLCAYLSARDERTELNLAADFFRVFIGNTQDTSKVAFPFESVYTSPEHLLMQDARDEVLAAYRAQGIVLNDEKSEPEDHIAFELDFMRLVGERALHAYQAGNTEECLNLLGARRVFLEDHLMNWAPCLADDMKRIARTGFYHALSDIMLGFLDQDKLFNEAALEAA